VVSHEDARGVKLTLTFGKVSNLFRSLPPAWSPSSAVSVKATLGLTAAMSSNALLQASKTFGDAAASMGEIVLPTSVAKNGSDLDVDTRRTGTYICGFVRTFPS
jgi:hypothetical protein